MTTRYTVRRTRPDGSVTFHGRRLTLAAATREAQAWRDTETERAAERAETGTDYPHPLTAYVRVMDEAEYHRDHHNAWHEAIAAGRRYHPNGQNQ